MLDAFGLKFILIPHFVLKNVVSYLAYNSLNTFFDFSFLFSLLKLHIGYERYTSL